jgi:hypothetical protein
MKIYTRAPSENLPIVSNAKKLWDSGAEILAKLMDWLLLIDKRVRGIEPLSLAWKAKVLPLHNTRTYALRLFGI